MKKFVSNKLPVSLALFIIAILVFTTAASAYWIWTPGTKKFINPKYAVKDSPKEQFDWAMSFYDAKDYQRAAAEFEKLVKQYEYSEYASKAQYYVGLSYDNMGKYYIAFQNYQKAIDNFPHIDNIDEIIAREYNIGKLYDSKASPKVLGTDIMTSVDRAIDIYKKVVDNAPYGKIADEAQFSMASALKRSERYDEAAAAFQKLIEDYPTSALRDKARYEVAQCAYKASLKPAYDIGPTDKAIKAFEELNQSTGNKELLSESDKTMKRLKDKSAEKSMITARFYESQKHYQSAVIYYQDVLDRFPDSSFETEARAKTGWLKEKIKNPKATPAGPARKEVRKEEVAKPKSKSWFPSLQFGKKTELPKEPSIEVKPEAEKKAAVIKEEAVPAQEIKTEKPVEAVKEAAPSKNAPEIKPEVQVENPATIAGTSEKSIQPDTAAPETKIENPETGAEAPEDEVESSVEKLKE